MNEELILKYFPQLSDNQKEQFSRLGGLYRSWNEKINVISRKDIDNVYPNHILHSLGIAKFLGNVEPGTTFLDLGTGGGLPGIPLAIIYPQAHFHLIDRVGKKITVASEIARELDLENITTQHGDVGECHERFNYVVSRAVMPLADLIRLSRRNIARGRTANRYANGLVCLKGGDLEEEIADARATVIDEPLSMWFSEPYFETKSVIYSPL